MRPIHQTTTERLWATDNPEGGIEKDPGPIFHLWNFGINQYQMKPEHATFLVGHPFVNFVKQQLLTGQPLMLTGAASISGDGSRNFNLAQRRSRFVKRAVMTVIRVRLPELARDLRQPDRRDAAIRTMAVGRDNAFMIRAGSRFQIPQHDEGKWAALNRRVSIWASVDHAQSREQIESIGGAVVRTRFPRVPENFRFWDMWSFSSSTINHFVPNPPMEADTNWGSRVPPEGNWAALRPGYQAGNTPPFIPNDFKKMEQEFVGPTYERGQIETSVNRFLDQAESAARELMATERRLVDWTRRTGEIGQSSILPELDRYLSFRRAMILDDAACALTMVGFRPVDFYSRQR